NVEIYELKEGRLSLYKRLTNDQYLKDNRLDASYVSRVRLEKPFPLLSLFTGANSPLIQNSTIKSGAPLFTIGVAFPDPKTNIVTHIAISDVRLDRLQRSFSMKLNGGRTLYLVDADGSVLAHKDDRLVSEGANYIDLPI